MEDFEDILYSIAKKVKVSFSFGAVEKLKDHDWNGNIRELKNTILRASAYYPGQRIGEQELPSIIDTPEGAESFCMHSDEDESLPPMKSIEKELIQQKLKSFFGNQRKVAEALKIPKSTLHDKIRNYKINPKVYKKRSRV